MTKSDMSKKKVDLFLDIKYFLQGLLSRNGF